MDMIRCIIWIVVIIHKDSTYHYNWDLICYGHLKHHMRMLLSMEDWILFNSSKISMLQYPFAWSAVWATTCHLLWYWRNKESHDISFRRPHHPWQEVLRSCSNYSQAQLAFQISMVSTSETIHVSWCPPSSGWVRLNSDGAVRGSDAVVGSGGLLRDDQGRWLCGYARHLGSCSAYITELWTVFLLLERRASQEWRFMLIRWLCVINLIVWILWVLWVVLWYPKSGLCFPCSGISEFLIVVGKLIFVRMLWHL